MPVLPEEQIHEESLGIGDIEKSNEELSNNRTKISDALPKLSGKRIDKELFDIGDIENSVEGNSDNRPKGHTRSVSL